jgi:rhamnogalacturonan acetylesterase
MGHNDGGSLDDPRRARGTLPGVGEETREIDNPITMKHEVVHTYGWYLRKYVADARAKKMTPILVSPIPHVPRQAVQSGEREPSKHVAWCEEVATAEKTHFIDLNRLVMAKYVGLDPVEVKAKYFTAADNGHTSAAGAELNAAAVAEGIRGLKESSLAMYLLPSPAAR